MNHVDFLSLTHEDTADDSAVRAAAELAAGGRLSGEPAAAAAVRRGHQLTGLKRSESVGVTPVARDHDPRGGARYRYELAVWRRGACHF